MIELCCIKYQIKACVIRNKRVDETISTWGLVSEIHVGQNVKDHANFSKFLYSGSNFENAPILMKMVSNCSVGYNKSNLKGHLVVVLVIQRSYLTCKFAWLLTFCPISQKPSIIYNGTNYFFVPYDASFNFFLIYISNSKWPPNDWSEKMGTNLFGFLRVKNTKNLPKYQNVGTSLLNNISYILKYSISWTN